MFNLCFFRTKLAMYKKTKLCIYIKLKYKMLINNTKYLLIWLISSFIVI